MTTDFIPSQHPRNLDGKFTTKANSEIEGGADALSVPMPVFAEPKRGKLSDAQALDALALELGTAEDWNGGDVCELLASMIAQTGRPHPGVGTEGTYPTELAVATGRRIRGYDSQGESVDALPVGMRASTTGADGVSGYVVSSDRDVAVLRTESGDEVEVDTDMLLPAPTEREKAIATGQLLLNSMPVHRDENQTEEERIMAAMVALQTLAASKGILAQPHVRFSDED